MVYRSGFCALLSAFFLCLACGSGSRDAREPVGFTDWDDLAREGELHASRSQSSPGSEPRRGGEPGFDLPAPLRAEGFNDERDDAADGEGNDEPYDEAEYDEADGGT